MAQCHNHPPVLAWLMASSSECSRISFMSGVSERTSVLQTSHNRNTN